MNTGLLITHDIYIYMNRYFTFLFDLTHDRGASEGYKSQPENGNIRTKFKFNEPLPEAVTCVPNLEFDNSVLVILLVTSRPTFNKGHRADTV